MLGTYPKKNLSTQHFEQYTIWISCTSLQAVNNETLRNIHNPFPRAKYTVQCVSSLCKNDYLQRNVSVSVIKSRMHVYQFCKMASTFMLTVK